MYERISELVDFLDAVQPKPILLVGDFLLDEYIFGDAERISPEAPVPVMRVVRREQRLGGAGLVASSLVGLGCKTYCAGILGADDAGGQVISFLEEIGADVSCLLRDPSVTTPLKQRLVGLAQHRIPQQLLRVDFERESLHPPPLLDELKERLEAILSDVALVAIEDYNKGLFGGSLSEWLIEGAAKRSIPVVVDPASIPDYGRYRGASVITPNRLEASLASGVRITCPEEARPAAEILRDRYAIQSVVVTLDADGMYLAAPETCQHVPTERREVFDVTGAGDVVLATLAFALAAGLDLMGASILANVAGGWEVQQAGAAPVTVEQLQWELLRRHRSHRGKVVTRRQLIKELHLLRRHGKRIVLTNGCFDLLHPGHITSFEFARRQGDLLVIGLNSDRSVRELKGPGRPLINEQDRARMIAALEAVDYVVIFDDVSVLSLVQDVKPDVLVKGQKGRDSRPDGVVGYEFVTGYGGKVVLAPIETEYSTSGVIGTILSRSAHETDKDTTHVG